jgi:hypothetical protein
MGYYESDSREPADAVTPGAGGAGGDSENYREGAADHAGIAHEHPHSEDQRSMEEVNAVRRNTGITPLRAER